MHKQVSGWTVNFGPNFPESPFLELKTSYSGIPPLPFWKTSDLGWPKFTPEYPPPLSENFRFGMTKVYSRIPPPPNENCQRVQVREFQNAESYYMWRLYPTRITTRFHFGEYFGLLDKDSSAVGAKCSTHEQIPVSMHWYPMITLALNRDGEESL